MNIEDFTTEELKSELKRRSELKRAERESIPRCKSCKFMIYKDDYELFPLCEKQTIYIKKYKRESFKRINKYAQACSMYERK